MHRAWWYAASWCGLVVGCGDPDADRETQYSTGQNPITTPPPVIEDEPDNGDSPIARSDHWGRCSSSDQCLTDEQCIKGITEPFNVCLAPCTTVDNCTDPSEPMPTNFTAFLTCTEFQGAARCVLACQSSGQCPAGMTCLSGTCVWR